MSIRVHQISAEKVIHRYIEYEITFERFYNSQEERRDLKEHATHANVYVLAENIDNAMKLAWQSVTFSPEDFEIVRVNKRGYDWE